ncbi:hypothetical protein M5K25_015334 [Dendrobium thyrsiflorum]|uniref:Uncharacterized protein n=1 Tax=Dendrobium thyrsiflorum TaxID=117978 RepID=A0ABD0UQ07_DENTH
MRRRLMSSTTATGEGALFSKTSDVKENVGDLKAQNSIVAEQMHSFIESIANSKSFDQDINQSDPCMYNYYQTPSNIIFSSTQTGDAGSLAGAILFVPPVTGVDGPLNNSPELDVAQTGVGGSLAELLRPKVSFSLQNSVLHRAASKPLPFSTSTITNSGDIRKMSTQTTRFPILPSTAAPPRPFKLLSRRRTTSPSSLPTVSTLASTASTGPAETKRFCALTGNYIEGIEIPIVVLIVFPLDPRNPFFDILPESHQSKHVSLFQPPSEPGVIQNSLDGYPCLRIGIKKAGKQPTELGGNPFRASVLTAVDFTDDPAGPNVDLSPFVALPGENLRGNVSRSTAKRVKQAVGANLFGHGGEAEIRDLKITGIIEEEVLRLEITVEDAARVAEGDGEDKLVEEFSGLVFGEATTGDVGEEFASLGVLHDEVDIGAGGEDFEESNDIWVVEAAHNDDLALGVNGEAAADNLCLADDLNGYTVTLENMAGVIDFGEGSDAEEPANFVLSEEDLCRRRRRGDAGVLHVLGVDDSSSAPN